MHQTLGIFAFFFLTSLGAQSGVHRLQDARSQAIGGTTVMNEGVFALMGNPAGLVHAQQWEGIASAETPFALWELQRAGFGVVAPLDNSSLGATIATFGEESYRETQISLAYSRLLNQQLSLGATVIYWNQNIAAYQRQGFLTFALGLQAQLYPELKAGVQLYNPFRVAVTDDETTYSTLQFGLSYLPSDKLTLIMEVYKDIDFPAQLQAGLDYQLADRIALRLGCSTRPERLSLGVGVRIFPNWWADIAASRHALLGFSPGFSLRYIKP